MSIYGQIYDTRPLATDFDWIVVYDLDLGAVYVGRGYPLASSLRVSADCAEANESLDFNVMGGVDGYIYRAYDDSFYSHGCPGEKIDWPVAIFQLAGLLPFDLVNTAILNIRSDPFRVSSFGNVVPSVKKLSGIDRRPSDGLFFATSGFYDGGKLYSINPNTTPPTIALIGPAGIPFTAIPAIAIDPADDTFYATAISTSFANHFVSLNPISGAASSINVFGTPSLAIEALAFHPQNGALYGLSALFPFSLYTIDKTTGVETFVGVLQEAGSGAPLSAAPAGMTFDGDGRLFASLGAGSGFIIQINIYDQTFEYLIDAAASSVSDLVVLLANSNAVNVGIQDGELPIGGDGLKGLTLTILRRAGSTRSQLTRIIESNTADSIIVTEAWGDGQEPQPGDTIVIGLISPFVDFAEQHPRFKIAVERIGFDAKSGDDDALKYTVQIFAADQGKNEVNLTAPAVERTFAEADVVRQHQGLAIRRVPTRAIRPRLTWHQLSAPMEIRRLDLDSQIYEEEDSRG